MSEEGHESAEYKTGCAMYRRGRKHNEEEGWGTAVHDVKGWNCVTARIGPGDSATVVCPEHGARSGGVSARCGRAGNVGRQVRSKAEQRR